MIACVHLKIKKSKIAVLHFFQIVSIALLKFPIPSRPSVLVTFLKILKNTDFFISIYGLDDIIINLTRYSLNVINIAII